MKKWKLITTALLTACVMAGCGSGGEAASVPVVQPVQAKPLDESAAAPSEPEALPQESEPESTETSGEDNVADSATIVDRQVVDGKMQSYLTGEWKDADVVQRRPMAVMIPNNRLKVPGTNTSATVPQHGISKASIIYEAPVEGRITRLMGVFEDYDDLERIGPVRSSRDYYIYESMAFDAIYCNWGLAVPYVAPLINTDRVDNISVKLEGIDVGYDNAFSRGLNEGYSKEFTSCLKIDGYTEGVEKLGYAKTYAERGLFKQAYLFANDGHRATYDGYPDATKVYPGGTVSNKGGYGSNTGDDAIRFEYNPEDGLYYRYQYGAPQVDADNNEQLAVSNVILKCCHGEVRDDHDYLAFGVHGTGEVYVFTNGKAIHGTWKRDGDYEPNMLYDDNGQEIVLNQGKTWLCCIWEEYSEYISYE